MSDTPPPSPPPERPATKAKLVFLVVFLVLALGTYGALFCPQLKSMSLLGIAPSAASKEQGLTDLEKHLDALDARLARLEQNPAPPVSSDDHAATSSTDIVAIQKDLASLSANVNALEGEVKRNDPTMTSASLASTMAFLDVRDKALSGQNFKEALAALRKADPNDKEGQDLIDTLEPYAAQSYPTLASLRLSLIELEGPALLALDRSKASTVGEKIITEMKSLISIRPLHGNRDSDILMTMEQDLAVGDGEGALTADKALPEEVQVVLHDWSLALEGRQKINGAVQALTDHFIARATGAASTSRDGQ